jgi:hypothetical protein
MTFKKLSLALLASSVLATSAFAASIAPTSLAVDNTAGAEDSWMGIKTATGSEKCTTILPGDTGVTKAGKNSLSPAFLVKSLCPQTSASPSCTINLYYGTYSSGSSNCAGKPDASFALDWNTLSPSNLPKITPSVSGATYGISLDGSNTTITITGG